LQHSENGPCAKRLSLVSQWSFFDHKRHMSNKSKGLVFVAGTDGRFMAMVKQSAKTCLSCHDVETKINSTHWRSSWTTTVANHSCCKLRGAEKQTTAGQTESTQALGGKQNDGCLWQSCAPGVAACKA
jgi:hypothetical protein